jgi:Bifunctional DNA primase/polymerase, N-terminal/Family of unknown function (DUF5906)
MTGPVNPTPGVESFDRQAERGFSLIPLRGLTKKPRKKVWQQHCTTAREFNQDDFQDCNAGVCCGPASGVLVLDIDDPLAFDMLVMDHGWSMPKTYTVRTGSGMKHLYFQYPKDGTEYGNRSFKHPVYPKHTVFDIRGTGGQVVAAGSIHPDTGQPYEVETDVDPAPIPDWLMRFLDREDIGKDVLWDVSLPPPKDREFVGSLKVSEDTRRLILEGKPQGERSDAVGKVMAALLGAGTDERTIFYLFDHYPIGAKYLEKGRSRADWLRGEIQRSRDFLAQNGGNEPRPREQGGVPYTEEHLQIIDELNQRHASVMLGGKFAVMNEVVDPVFGRHDVTFSSLPDFKARYAHRTVTNPHPGNPRDINVAALWHKSPRRQHYDGIVFSPGKEVPGYYNLYRGFDVDPVQGDWSLMQEHIYKVIAGGNQEAGDYILAWMAQLVQQPGEKRPGTSIVLRGKQGTGKGCFVTEFGKVLGSHFLHITNQRQITGRFNNHLKDALLVFVDEGIWAGSKSDEGVLKAMITEDQILVEPKGKDPYSVRNHIRMIVASNNEWVVPAGSWDRRFFVLDVSDKHMQDREYFGSVFQQMGNGGREAMLHDLLQMDLSKVDLGSFPQTEARLDQIVASMSSVEKFWLDGLYDGKLNDHRSWDYPHYVKDVYENYQEFAKGMGDRFPLSRQQFGKKLRTLCPGIVREREKNASRSWQYKLPDLETSRRAFETFVGQKIDWD